jgi:hypothetical protein
MARRHRVIGILRDISVVPAAVRTGKLAGRNIEKRSGNCGKLRYAPPNPPSLKAYTLSMTT